MLGLIGRFADVLKGIFGESLISVSLVGSAAYAATRGLTADPHDIDIVVVADVDRVSGEDLVRVRDAVARACRSCKIYVATSTYCHSMVERPSTYIMVYPGRDYAEKVSVLLRASWAEYNVALHGQSLEEISSPQPTPETVVADAYGIKGCMDALERGVYESKPTVLGPGDRVPKRLRVPLEGAAEEKFLRYCWRWQAYNALRALGYEADPYRETELAEALGELLGVRWPPRPPTSRRQLARLLRELEGAVKAELTTS